MQNSKLFYLLENSAKANLGSTEEVSNADIIYLSEEFASKIYGGNEPVNTGCTNNACRNEACSSANNPKNDSCNNSSCNTSGMTNSTCTNGQCSNGGGE